MHYGQQFLLVVPGASWPDPELTLCGEADSQLIEGPVRRLEVSMESLILAQDERWRRA